MKSIVTAEKAAIIKSSASIIFVSVKENSLSHPHRLFDVQKGIEFACERTPDGSTSCEGTFVRLLSPRRLTAGDGRVSRSTFRSALIC